MPACCLGFYIGKGGRLIGPSFRPAAFETIDKQKSLCMICLLSFGISDAIRIGQLGLILFPAFAGNFLYLAEMTVR